MCLCLCVCARICARPIRLSKYEFCKVFQFEHSLFFPSYFMRPVHEARDEARDEAARKEAANRKASNEKDIAWP